MSVREIARAPASCSSGPIQPRLIAVLTAKPTANTTRPTPPHLSSVSLSRSRGGAAGTAACGGGGTGGRIGGGGGSDDAGGAARPAASSACTTASRVRTRASNSSSRAWVASSLMSGL